MIQVYDILQETESVCGATCHQYMADPEYFTQALVLYLKYIINCLELVQMLDTNLLLANFTRAKKTSTKLAPYHSGADARSVISPRR